MRRLHDPGGRQAPLPRVTLPELHVLIFSASRGGRAHLAGADGGEFAGSGAASEGELAGDFGAKMSEEVGHGEEARADDAGGDFGDAVVVHCFG